MEKEAGEHGETGEGDDSEFCVAVMSEDLGAVLQRRLHVHRRHCVQRHERVALLERTAAAAAARVRSVLLRLAIVAAIECAKVRVRHCCDKCACCADLKRLLKLHLLHTRGGDGLRITLFDFF